MAGSTAERFAAAAVLGIAEVHNRIDYLGVVSNIAWRTLFDQILEEVQPLVDRSLRETGNYQDREPSVPHGLADGTVVVLDYIDHNEAVVGFEHLAYMIAEPPVRVSAHCFGQLGDLGTILGVAPAVWEIANPVGLFGALPDGWTLERAKEEGGLKSAPHLLPLRTAVFEEGVSDLLVIDPLAILKCGELVLAHDKNDRHWHMGQTDGDEVFCWGSYGDDLGVALRGL